MKSMHFLPFSMPGQRFLHKCLKGLGAKLFESMSIGGLSGLAISSALGITLLTAWSSPASAQSLAQRSCQPYGRPVGNRDLIALRNRNRDWISNNLANSFEIFAILGSYGPRRTVRPNARLTGNPNPSRFTSPYRAEQSGGQFGAVEPDGLRDLSATVRVIGSAGTVLLIRIRLVNFFFYEVKTSLGPLRPVSGSGSLTNSWQMGGLVDVTDLESRERYERLKNQLAKQGLTLISARETPFLVVASPSSTTIHPDLVQLATSRKVAIYRSVSCLVPGNREGIDELQMGDLILVNQELLSPPEIPSGLTGGVESTIVQPVSPPNIVPHYS